MAGMNMYILGAVALLLLIPAHGLECHDNHKATKSSKRFLVVYDGPLEIKGERENFVYNLGECRSPEVHAEKMIEHFQTRYSINLTHIRQNPFKMYEEDNFIVNQNAASPKRHDYVVSSYTNGSAKFMNTPLYWATWFLSAKSDLTTPMGTVKATNVLAYGMFRLKDEGQDVCMEYMPRAPTGLQLPQSGTTAVDVILKSPELGEGQALGMGILNGGDLSFRYSLTFNGNKP